MTEKSKEPRLCPRCGCKYEGYPALSRVDSKTHVCADCGLRESLESVGIPSEEQEKIIEAIHRSELPEPTMYERND